MKKISTVILLLVAVVLIGFGTFYFNSSKVPNASFGLAGSPAWNNSYRNAAINTSSTITTAASRVLTSSINRLWAYGGNIGSNTVYCSKIATSTGVSATTGFALYAQGSFEFDERDPYQGDLWCLTSTGTSSLAISYVTN